MAGSVPGMGPQGRRWRRGVSHRHRANGPVASAFFDDVWLRHVQVDSRVTRDGNRARKAPWKALCFRCDFFFGARFSRSEKWHDKELYMTHRPKRLRTLILLGIVFALVAAACTSSDSDTADSGLVTIVARCKAAPNVEDGRCNNLLRGVVAANAQLAADGDDRRVEVRIIQDNPDAGDYVTEFELASSAGEAPDIIAAAAQNIGTWGASGIVADLTDLIDDYPEFDDMIPSLWASTELDGKRYGVPQDAEARPLYFRKDLLAELGWAQDEIDSLPARLASGESTSTTVRRPSAPGATGGAAAETSAVRSVAAAKPNDGSGTARVQKGISNSLTATICHNQ